VDGFVEDGGSFLYEVNTVVDEIKVFGSGGSLLL